MAAFCTVADIAAFLQLAIAADNAAALRAIEEASAAIQNHCHQVLELVEDEDVTFDVAQRQAKLFLPELPVVEVSAVEENGTTLAEADYKLGNYGILYRLNAWWYPGVQAVTTTYSHGYATIPDDIVGVCTRAAARSFQAGLRAAEAAGVSGVQGMSLGDYSVTYGSEQSGGVSGGAMLGASAAPILLPSEKVILNKHRYRGA